MGRFSAFVSQIILFHNTMNVENSLEGWETKKWLSSVWNEKTVAPDFAESTLKFQYVLFIHSTGKPSRIQQPTTPLNRSNATRKRIIEPNIVPVHKSSSASEEHHHLNGDFPDVVVNLADPSSLPTFRGYFHCSNLVWLCNSVVVVIVTLKVSSLKHTTSRLFWNHNALIFMNPANSTDE